MSEGGDKETPTDDEEEETTEEEEEETEAAGAEAKSPEEEEDTEEEEGEKDAKSIGKASDRTEAGGVEGGDTAKTSATGTDGTGSALPSGSVTPATSSDARSSRLTNISNAMPSVNFGFSLSKWVEIFKNFPPPRDEDLPRSVICGLSEGATTKSKDKEQQPPPKPAAGGQPVAEAEILEPDFTEDESELSISEDDRSDGPRTPDYEDGDRSLTNIQQVKDKKDKGGKQKAGGGKGSRSESTDEDEEDAKKLSSDESIFLSL